MPLDHDISRSPCGHAVAREADKPWSVHGSEGSPSQAVLCRRFCAPGAQGHRDQHETTGRFGSISAVTLAQEVIRDLLACDAPAGAQPAVNIREVAGGGVCLAGAREQEVRPVSSFAR